MSSDSGTRGSAVDPLTRRLVDKYLENRRQDIDKLSRAVAAADFETLRITGHNLYGSGSAYGFDEITTIGAGIEQAATSEDTGKIRDLIAQLEGVLQNLGISQNG